MSENLTPEELIKQFEGQVDGGFHWQYDGPRKATIVGTKVEPNERDESRLEVVLTLLVDDEEKPDQTVALSVGGTDQYESLDGVTIQGPAFRQRSWYGIFNNAVLKVAKDAILKRGISPKNTQYAVGFQGTFEPTQVVFGKDRDTGKEIVGTRPMPVSFDGFVDVDTLGGTAATTPTAATSGNDIMATLQAIAAEVNSNADFIVKALPVAGPDLAGKIASGELYKELKG